MVILVFALSAIVRIGINQEKPCNDR